MLLLVMRSAKKLLELGFRLGVDGALGVDAPDWIRSGSIFIDLFFTLSNIVLVISLDECSPPVSCSNIEVFLLLSANSVLS